MMGSMAPSNSGKETCNATCTGWRPNSEASHSWNDWNTKGTAHRYGTPNDFNVSTAFGWSCEAGPPTNANPVKLMTESTATPPWRKKYSLTGPLKSSPPE